MTYGYWLGKVFKEVGIQLGEGTKGIMKQVISLNTLMESECVEGQEQKEREISSI